VLANFRKNTRVPDRLKIRDGVRGRFTAAACGCGSFVAVPEQRSNSHGEGECQRRAALHFRLGIQACGWRRLGRPTPEQEFSPSTTPNIRPGRRDPGRQLDLCDVLVEVRMECRPPVKSTTALERFTSLHVVHVGSCLATSKRTAF